MCEETTIAGLPSFQSYVMLPHLHTPWLLFLLPTSTSGHVGCLRISVTVNDAAMAIGIYLALQESSFNSPLPRSEASRAWFFQAYIFWGTIILLPVINEPIDFPNNIVNISICLHPHQHLISCLMLAVLPLCGLAFFPHRLLVILCISSNTFCHLLIFAI